jgi:hypothetical protein
MTYYFFNSIGFAKIVIPLLITYRYPFVVGWFQQPFELRFRFSGFSGFNTTHPMTVFSSIATKCQLCDHAFPRHDQELMGRNNGFLNQFLIDKEDYRFRSVESSSLIGSIWIFNGIVFLAKYLLNPFTITSAMIN